MGSIGATEVLVVLLAALIILGPKRLPDAAKQVGKAFSELRRVTSGFQNELHDALDGVDPRTAMNAPPTPAAATTPLDPHPEAEVAQPSTNGETTVS